MLSDKREVIENTQTHTYRYTHTFASQSRKPENPPKKTEDFLDIHTYTHTRTYKAPKS